jgi:predicted PurR-regulated permease PerM
MNDLPRWYVITVTVFVIVLAVYFFGNVISYLLVAGLLSFAGRPIMRFLDNRKIKGRSLPNAVSAIITIFVMIVSLLLVLAIFVPLIAIQVNQVANTDMGEVANKLEPTFVKVQDFLDKIGVANFEDQSLSDYLLEKVKNVMSLGFVSGFVNNIFGVLGSIGIAFASTVFILFFFLKDRDLFQRILILMVADEYEAKVLKAIDKTNDMLTRYILGILLQLVCNFAFLAIILGVLGIHNFLLIALLGAVLNIIPYLGPFIGMALGLSIAITGNLDMDFGIELLPLVLKVGLTFGFNQMFDNYFLTPVIFSKSAHAHPLEIFVVILAAGTIGGIGAMIIAIPAFTVFRVVGQEFFSDTKFMKALTKDV